MPRDEKIKRLSDLFNLAPLKRIKSIFGDDSNKALELYDRFLTVVSNAESRDALAILSKADAESDEKFRILREAGRQFSLELSKLLEIKYRVDHPIHQALIF